MNPLLDLKKLGQSVWYDNLRKGLVASGELKRMIEEYAVSGVTSNPNTFERAIAGTNEYDEDISKLLKEGLDDEAILSRLMTRDVRLAADQLSGIFRDTGGADGFVSIEVDPGLATDAGSTVREATRLFEMVDRPNVMVKVPGTSDGLKALEELTYEGRNVNVTLLFSIDRYAEVADAYLAGLERRLAEGLPIDTISSVASFFVSRVDTIFDRILEERIEKTSSNDEKARLKDLLGRVAAANAKLAYSKFEAAYSGERFRKLKDAGAKPQRLLWASTGTKNPRFPDIKYVEELVKDGTVNTMPLHTLLAFYDHGKARVSLTDDIAGAEKLFGEMKSLAIDYQAACRRLEEEGIEAFRQAHLSILMSIAAKRETLEKKRAVAPRYSLNGYASEVSEALQEVCNENFLERLWAKDPTLWKTGAQEKKQIKNSLGWVALTRVMDDHVDEIDGFAREVRDAGFRDVVLLGMGGSSLAPLVFAETFGAVPGYPRLTVLDSTDPGAVDGVSRSIDAGETLFIVSSKSGSTIEPLSLFEFFHEKVRMVKGGAAGRNFIAITDPGTALEGFAKKYGFRKLFTNPKDIGGRFSALSYFGLVPAALMGVDIGKLLEYGARVEEAIHPCGAESENPVIMLGAAIGTLGRLGRDKLTFFISSEVAALGMWLEQLIAESTGKEGKGLVPVVGEPLGRVEDYGDDRVFIFITLGAEDRKFSSAMETFAEAGHPVVELRLSDPYELGGEFLRWEVATSVAGQILGINPFDQPDVELAKKLTAARLSEIGKPEGLKPPGVGVEANGFGVYFGKNTFKKLSADGSAREMLGEFFGLVKAGDYIGVLAYYNPADRRLTAEFTELRRALRDSTGAATQFGYGPRYLHSTGQLHKGGPDRGLFIILCHKPEEDLKVPGSQFSFSELELSQAFGDMEALDSKGLRVALVDLKDPSIETLRSLEELLLSAAAS